MWSLHLSITPNDTFTFVDIDAVGADTASEDFSTFFDTATGFSSVAPSEDHQRWYT